VIHKLVGS